jgi:hypothetical protein
MALFTNWITEHPYTNNISDALFSELHPSALRLRRSYDQPKRGLSAAFLFATDGEIIDAADKRNNLPMTLIYFMITALADQSKRQAC